MQAPETQKNAHFPQKIIAPGTGSLDGSGFGLGREHVRHDVDVSSFNGVEMGQAGTHGHPQGGGPPVKAQSFPVKSRHVFTKGQAKVNEDVAVRRGS